MRTPAPMEVPHPRGLPTPAAPPPMGVPVPEDPPRVPEPCGAPEVPAPRHIRGCRAPFSYSVEAPRVMLVPREAGRSIGIGVEWPGGWGLNWSNVWGG